MRKITIYLSDEKELSNEVFAKEEDLAEAETDLLFKGLSCYWLLN